MPIESSNNEQSRVQRVNRAGFGLAMLAHGGAGSDSKDSDGPESAVRIGMERMASGQPALDAVVHAVRHLEADPRFNAGTGSQFRADGRTIQMDAACMTSQGQFGAVACISDVDHPIDIAQGVLLYSPHILLSGDGARTFASQQQLIDRQSSGISAAESCQSMDPEPRKAPSCDTVGAVAFDGVGFAVALSSGGLENAAIGRIGDVPLPGCGLFCGPLGAVACTGDGEFIALKMLAREVYGWLAQGISPWNATRKAMSLFDQSVDLGLIVLTKTQYASHACNDMAWAQRTDSA